MREGAIIVAMALEKGIQADSKMPEDCFEESELERGDDGLLLRRTRRPISHGLAHLYMLIALRRIYHFAFSLVLPSNHFLLPSAVPVAFNTASYA